MKTKNGPHQSRRLMQPWDDDSSVRLANNSFAQEEFSDVPFGRKQSFLRLLFRCGHGITWVYSRSGCYIQPCVAGGRVERTGLTRDVQLLLLQNSSHMALRPHARRRTFGVCMTLAADNTIGQASRKISVSTLRRPGDRRGRSRSAMARFPGDAAVPSPPITVEFNEEAEFLSGIIHRRWAVTELRHRGSCLSGSQKCHECPRQFLS